MQPIIILYYKMNRISVFAFAILLCSIVLALGPGVKVAIKQSTINNIKDQAIPIIMRQLKEITVPNINGNAGPIKYSISSIRARMESLAPSNVAIRLIPNSNRVGVSVSNLRGSGNFHVEFQFLFIKAGVDGSASINGVGVNVEMAFAYDGEGRPTANVAQFGINMGVNNVGISFSGSILAALVNVVVNLLKPIFVNIMRSILNNAVPGVMNNLINQLIRQLPMSVDISPALAIAFRLPKTPWVNSDYMCVAIAGYVYYKPSPHPPAYEPKACPDYEPASQKGIHFFLTDYVIRSALDATYSAGLMTIQVPVQADQYDIVMDCGATSAPVLQFSNSIVGMSH